MEVLDLKWTSVDLRAGLVRLEIGSNKSGAGRVLPFTDYSQLAEVIERRRVVAKRLAVAGVIAPWLFCFEKPLQVRRRTYHVAGGPLFKPSGDRGLLNALRDEWSAACQRAGFPGRMFHDLRRSAARNFERADIPRSVARRIGGWSDKIYSRYAIGTESELGEATSRIGDYIERSGWHSGGTPRESSMKSSKLVAEGRGSRTLRQHH